MSADTSTKQRSSILRELDELGNQEAHLSGAAVADKEEAGAGGDALNLSDQVDAAFEDDDRIRLQKLTDSVRKAGGFPVVGDYEDSGERRKKRNAAQRQRHNRIYIDGDDDDDDVEIIDADDAADAVKSGEIDDDNDMFSPEFHRIDQDRTNPTKMFSLEKSEKRRRLIHHAATNDTPLGRVVNNSNVIHDDHGDDSPLRSNEPDATEIMSITPVNSDKVRRQTARLQNYRADLQALQRQRNVQVIFRNQQASTTTNGAHPTTDPAIEAIDSMFATADAKIERELDKIATMLTAMRDLENTRTQVRQFSALFGTREQKK